MSKGVAHFGEEFFLIKSDNDLIKENIERILLTAPGERVMNTTFGCNLKNYIFEPDVILKEDVLSDIRKSITKWEPRVEITFLNATMTDPGVAKIEISLINRTTLEPFDYNTIIRL
jgi:phage baseplate assembly protein W